MTRLPPSFETLEVIADAKHEARDSRRISRIVARRDPSAEFDLPNADAVLSEILALTKDATVCASSCGDYNCDVIKRIRGVIKRYRRKAVKS